MDAKGLRRALAHWARANCRDLPWRRTRDAYAVLVSEIMLQQTPVGTVIPYYNKWLRRFPDAQALARAREQDVLHAWQGLGYYSRACNLHRCAKEIVNRYHGNLPQDPRELSRLPGIGRYTANAVAVFAYNRRYPIVEANTARVLSRLFNIRLPIDSKTGWTMLWDCSARLLPQRNVRKFHSDLMDLGALICTTHHPRCSACPVKKFCAATNPSSLPVKRKRPETTHLTESHSFITRPGAILLQQCRRRWRGMWMLPEKKTRSGVALHASWFPFTNHRIRLKVFAGKTRPLRLDERWIRVRDLSTIPIPSPHRRAISAFVAASR